MQGQVIFVLILSLTSLASARPKASIFDWFRYDSSELGSSTTPEWTSTTLREITTTTPSSTRTTTSRFPETSTTRKWRTTTPQEFTSTTPSWTRATTTRSPETSTTEKWRTTTSQEITSITPSWTRATTTRSPETSTTQKWRTTTPQEITSTTPSWTRATTTRSPETSTTEKWRTTTPQEITSTTLSSTRATTTRSPETNTPTVPQTTTAVWTTSTGTLPGTPPITETVICKNSPSSYDNELENIGDLVCAAHESLSRDDELLVRDTVINYDNELSLHYQKHLTQVVITRVNVLNFGRQHGFTKSVEFKNENKEWSKNASVNVEISAEEEVRLFVEIYGRKY